MDEATAFDAFVRRRRHIYACVLPGEIVREAVPEYSHWTSDPGTLLGISYLIVDEFQDLNPVDIQFIDDLINGGANAFVAGDDDQSVYSFRMAPPRGCRASPRNTCVSESGRNALPEVVSLTCTGRDRKDPLQLGRVRTMAILTVGTPTPEDHFWNVLRAIDPVVAALRAYTEDQRNVLSKDHASDVLDLIQALITSLQLYRRLKQQFVTPESAEQSLRNTQKPLDQTLTA